MQNKKQIIMCEHCGNKSPHEIIFSTSGPDEIVEVFEGETFGMNTFYFLARCASCSDVSLFSDWEESNDLGSLDEAVLMYPAPRKIDKVVPSAIIRDFDEAKKVMKKSPLAFAVLIRRALENVCTDQSAKGRNLKEKIDDLAQKEIVPKSLARMANAIRYLGNIGAHASDENVSEDEAKILDDFIRAIIEYVYVAPAKLNKLLEKMEKKPKTKSPS